MASTSLVLGALFGVFVCAFVSIWMNNVSEGRLPVTTDRLMRHLEAGFSERRSFLQPEQKDKARKYIKDFFNNLASKHSTSVIEQNYVYDNPLARCGGSTCPGVNYLWILPGSRYGTPQDKVYLVGAHYDTREDTPGVDDNGSGMAAMLETARILSESELACARLNSVAFVAFDWEELPGTDQNSTFMERVEDVVMGSATFVEEIQTATDSLSLSDGTFQGAVILETMMNWDDTENSQDVPLGLDMLFPALYAELEADGFRGTDLNIMQRVDDAAIGNGLAGVWTNLADSRYGTKVIELPAYASGQVSLWPPQVLAGVSDFLRSDHTNFWNHTTPDKKGLKAVFLSDTANFRGVMRQCYHSPCDGLDLVTPKKLEFLAKATEMLVRYYLQQITEKTATECVGEPQENWDPVSGTSSTTSAGVSWLLLVVMVTIGNQVWSH